MTEPPNELTRPRFVVDVTTSSRLAWFRAWTVLERTISTWVLTAITLIGFGFTIVQFFERLNDMEGVAPAAQPFAARYVGLVLIGAGVVALGVATVQYRATIRYLWQDEFSAVAGIAKTPGNTPMYAVTIALMVIGVAAFAAVLVRAI